jgi:hypothetical protein
MVFQFDESNLGEIEWGRKTEEIVVNLITELLSSLNVNAAKIKCPR